MHIQGFNVPVIRDILHSRVGHAELFALINIGSSLQAVKQGGQHLGGFHPVFSIVTPAGDDAGQVMIVPEQTVPSAAVEGLLPFRQHLLELPEIQRSQIPFFFPRNLIQTDVLKLEHHGKLASVRIAVKLRVFRVRAPGLAHGDQIPLLERFSGELLDKFMQPRPVVGDFQVRLLGDLVDHVQAEAAHALVHPPQDHVIDFPAQLRILPV